VRSCAVARRNAGAEARRALRAQLSEHGALRDVSFAAIEAALDAPPER